MLAALAAAISIATMSGAGLDSTSGSGPRLGGDFPAFYGAGSIVWNGDLDQLYDFGRQEEAQAGLGIDGYLAFAYPPHVAVAYAPLGALDYQAAYALHTVAMIAAVVGAVWLLRPVVPGLDVWFVPVVAATLTFYPLFTALGGGQNTGVSILGFAAIWRLLADDDETKAGAVAGLLLFRPQYALPVIGLLLLRGHWRAMFSAFGVGLVTWALTAAVMGLGWMAVWIEQVRPFVERDAEVNAANSISILGFAHALFGVEDTLVNVVGALAAVAVGLTMVRVWFGSARPLPHAIAVVTAGVLLMSPHTMFYDAGLLVICGLALSVVAGASRVVIVATVVWFGALLHLANETIGASPLVFLVAGAFAIAVHPTLIPRFRSSA